MSDSRGGEYRVSTVLGSEFNKRVLDFLRRTPEALSLHFGEGLTLNLVLCVSSSCVVGGWTNKVSVGFGDMSRNSARDFCFCSSSPGN